MYLPYSRFSKDFRQMFWHKNSEVLRHFSFYWYKSITAAGVSLRQRTLGLLGRQMALEISLHDAGTALSCWFLPHLPIFHICIPKRLMIQCGFFDQLEIHNPWTVSSDFLKKIPRSIGLIQICLTFEEHLLKSNFHCFHPQSLILFTSNLSRGPKPAKLKQITHCALWKFLLPSSLQWNSSLHFRLSCISFLPQWHLDLAWNLNELFQIFAVLSLMQTSYVQ